LIKNNIPIQKQYEWSKQYPNLGSSPELAYVLGVIDGDGSVGGYNRIELEVKDKVFAKAFAGALKAIELRANIIKNDRQNKDPKRRHHYWFCYANSVVFVDWYNGLTQEQREKIAKQYPLEYLRGFYESEGTYFINTSGGVNIFFSNFDYDLLLMVQKLLTLIGLKSKIYENERKTCFAEQGVTLYTLRLLGSVEEKHEFIRKLKPCIKFEPYDYSGPNGLRGYKRDTLPWC